MLNVNKWNPVWWIVFRTPEATLAQRGITYLQNWLTIAEPMVEKSIRTADATGDHGDAGH